MGVEGAAMVVEAAVVAGVAVVDVEEVDALSVVV